MANKKQKSYFKTSVHRYYLDDGSSYIEHKPMDEGTYQGFQDITSDIQVDSTGQNTTINLRLGLQRDYLFDRLVTNWNLVDIVEVEEDGKKVEKEEVIPFTPLKLKQLPPHVLNGLVEDIYKHNPILSGEEEQEGK